MKMPITSLGGKKVGEVDLDDSVFGLRPRASLLQRMVRYQLAKRRSGTHKTKRRGEIKGSTKKIYRQKGTGGARHGARSANIFRGGGKAHGPLTHSHEHDMPKKLRNLALKHALSSKQLDGTLIVLDGISAETPKTAQIAPKLKEMHLSRALIIDGNEGIDKNFALASRNLPGLRLLPLVGINVYDILRHEKLALTKTALEGLSKRFQEERPSKESVSKEGAGL